MVDPTPVPDTAMDTGSEDGEPGGGVDAAPLTDDERAMLDRLRHAGGPDVVGTVAEDTPGPPPLASTSRPDPLDPIFREPTA